MTQGICIKVTAVNGNSHRKVGENAANLMRYYLKHDFKYKKRDNKQNLTGEQLVTKITCITR